MYSLSSAAAAMLQALPTELSQHINTFLDKGDLAQLRLTSSLLLLTSYDAFGAAHFGLLHTDLRPESFIRVWQVANHDIFRSAVRELIVGNKYIPEPMDLDGVANSWDSTSWVRLPSGSLDPKQPWVQTVRDTVLKFTNCETFRLRDRSDWPSPSSTEITASSRGLSSTDVIAIILSSIALENMPIATLDIQLLGDDELEYDLLHPQLYQLDSFKTAWGSNLRSLNLYGSLSCNDSANIVADVISKASNLNSLELFGIGFGNPEAGRTCLRRLAQLRLPSQLSTLVISSGGFMQGDILSLICTKSLCSVHLAYLELDGNPETMFKDMRKSIPPLDLLWLESLIYGHDFSSSLDQYYEFFLFHPDIDKHPQITGSDDMGDGYLTLKIFGGEEGMEDALETISRSFCMQC